MRQFYIFLMLIGVLIATALGGWRVATRDQLAVEKLVTAFGQRIKNIPLAGPKYLIRQELEENYSPLVSPDLLESWLANPASAPGRLTSSPWPERIRIGTIVKTKNESYRVQASVIELTSEELAHGGVAAVYPVILNVQKISNRWLITDWEAN